METHNYFYQVVNPFGIWDQADMTPSLSSRIGDFLFLRRILSLLGVTYSMILECVEPLIDNLDTLKEGPQKGIGFISIKIKF